MTRSTSQLWRDHLTSRSHQLTMKEAQIDDLKRGSKFSKAIELPRELMLSARQMCDMLVERETIRQFTHLRSADTHVQLMCSTYDIYKICPTRSLVLYMTVHVYTWWNGLKCGHQTRRLTVLNTLFVY